MELFSCLRKLRCDETFLQIPDIWAFHLRSSEIVRPSIFTEGTTSILLPLISLGLKTSYVEKPIRSSLHLDSFSWDPYADACKPVVSPYIPSLRILSGGITNSWQLPRYNLPVHFLVVIINCLANWTPIQQRQSYADSVPTSLPLLPSVEWCHNVLHTMQHFRLHATPLFIASGVGSDISLSSLEFNDVGSAIFPVIVELITTGTANQIIQWSLITGAQAPDSKSRTNVQTVDERNAFKRHKDVSKNLHLPYYQWGNVQNFKNSRSFLK